MHRYLENRDRDRDAAASTCRTPARSPRPSTAARESWNRGGWPRICRGRTSSCRYAGPRRSLTPAWRAADTLVTPINDSFVDFDLIGQVDAETFKVKRLSSMPN
jgi:hypothetical protein